MLIATTQRPIPEGTGRHHADLLARSRCRVSLRTRPPAKRSSACAANLRGIDVSRRSVRSPCQSPGNSTRETHEAAGESTESHVLGSSHPQPAWAMRRKAPVCIASGTAYERFRSTCDPRRVGGALSKASRRGEDNRADCRPWLA